MVANQEVVVGATKTLDQMKRIISIAAILIPMWVLAQKGNDTTMVFKKRVLEAIEIDILTSYYTQDGKNAAVTGGIGTEELSDFATDVKISIPINADAILTISATVSAYSSASSSNLNPWSGASKGDDDDDDDEYEEEEEDDDDEDDDFGNGSNIGSPWVASSGASRKDVWTNLNVGYSHSSNDRNTIMSGNLSFSNEYDYTSIGGSAGIAKLFNKKNTEISLNASLFLDGWRPQYPTEIKTYIETNGDLNKDFFKGTDILDENGNRINKLDPDAWKPYNTSLIENKKRNTFAISLGFSQIVSKTTQISVFSDLTYQTGWLANPMQRVYFADKPNFYIGNAVGISNYQSPVNQEVFQLADDIERLPDTRIKIPIGVRMNQYISENLVLRTYYRYYLDDWGLQSHTFNAEVAIKIGQNLTMYPNYRFYNQTAADFFAPFDELLSTSESYTSDFDLSEYTSSQIGLGVKYTDIFTKSHIWKFGLKGLTFDYNYYTRDTGLHAHIVSFGTAFVIDK